MKPLFVSMFAAACFSSACDSSSFWAADYQSEFDYLQDYSSKIELDGYQVGGSYSFDSSWSMSVNYFSSSGEASWQKQITDASPVSEFAQMEQRSLGLGLLILHEKWASKVTLNRVKANDQALLRAPFELDRSESQDKSLSYSMDYLINSEKWSFDPLIGIQYLHSEGSLLQQFATDPVTQIFTEYTYKSWSVFTDLSVGYWHETTSGLTFNPQFTLGWTFPIEENDEQSAIVRRGGFERPFTSVSDRQLQGIRTPDSGFWEVAFALNWKNGWGTRLSYTNSLQAPTDVSTSVIEISYSF